MSHVQSITTLPLLDLSQLDGSPQQRQQFLDELRLAARHIGFFYLTGHGIDPALLAQVQQQARAFFALPEADKLDVGMINSPHFRGKASPCLVFCFVVYLFIARYTAIQRAQGKRVDSG